MLNFETLIKRQALIDARCQGLTQSQEVNSDNSDDIAEKMLANYLFFTDQKPLRTVPSGESAQSL